jgi:hypothetical protein
MAERVEVMGPKATGYIRKVVPAGALGAMLAQGYVKIEESELPLTHDWADLGLDPNDAPSVPEEPEKPEELEGEPEDAPAPDLGKSKDHDAADLPGLLSQLQTVEEVHAFIEGDDRAATELLATDRLAELGEGEALLGAADPEQDSDAG